MGFITKQIEKEYNERLNQEGYEEEREAHIREVASSEIKDDDDLNEFFDYWFNDMQRFSEATDEEIKDLANGWLWGDR